MAPNIAFDFVTLFVAGVLFITCVIIAVEMFCEDTNETPYNQKGLSGGRHWEGLA
jgi:hypothetical protein